MYAIRLLLTLSLLLPPLFAHAGASDWIPLTVRDGKLLIHSTFAGVDGYSIIDTGADHSAINVRFLAKNGLSLPIAGETSVRGFFEKQTRPFHKDLTATLLGVRTRFNRLSQVSLKSDNAQLLFGGDFLQQFIFQFDYPNQRMRWLTRDTLDLKMLSNVPSKKDKQTRRILAKVTLDTTQDLWVTVDTGAKSGLWLERSLAARKGWLTEHQATLKRASGVNGKGYIEQFRLPLVKLGEFESTDALVSVAAKGQQHALFQRKALPGSRIQRNTSKFRGLLGWDVLKDFVVTIDYKIGKIHLQPGTAV